MVRAVLVEAADGVSAARPGARRGILESCQPSPPTDSARSFRGVDAAYAIQAGRELRIITKSDQISDVDTYQSPRTSPSGSRPRRRPGNIKVTVIREHRATEFAR